MNKDKNKKDLDITTEETENAEVESNVTDEMKNEFEGQIVNIDSPNETNGEKLSAEAKAQLESDEEEFKRIKIISPGKMVAKRFFRSKLSMIGLVMLAALFIFSFAGPIFSSYGETEKVGASKEVISVIPHTINVTEDGVVVQYHFYEVSDPYLVYTKTAPTWQNWLGTDQYGYDVLTRLMYGGRVSLTLGFGVIILETLLGTFLGALAGYFGKWVDQLIMRIVDIFNCLPGLPILMLAAALIDGWGVPGRYKIYCLLGILTIFGWSGIARLVRGQILGLRGLEYMIAAEATGLSTKRKIMKHLIPNVMPQLIVSATLGLGGVILYESTLSYLGLGVPIPYAAWGTMIGSTSGTTGREILQNYPNIWIPAGVCIVMAVLAFNFIGDGLRDAFDPKMKR
ncbi:MAG: ABC transporter permease [Bacilli bacterium]